MNTFSCIKCNAQYSTEEDEAYYCESCLAVRKSVAEKIDATIKTVGQEPNSDYQRYENAPKVRGFANARDIL